MTFSFYTIIWTLSIELMVKQLQDKDYVGPDFKEKILERENLSSTALGYFAIPHTINFNASRTAFCVLISKNNIKWGDKNVKLVIMMAFNENERAIFNDIYEPLTRILLNQDNNKKLLNSKNYEEFVDNLVDSI